MIRQNTNILHRQSHHHLPKVASGNGVYIIDTNGKQYLDACGGAAVSCLGHSNQAVKDAIKAQLDAIPYAHTGFFTSEIAEKLADKLVKKAPDNIDKAYFVTGGSEANETALKLARQYFVEIGQPERKYFIAREQSYHGSTIKTLSIAGNEWRKQTYLPILPESHLIEPCYAYRHQKNDETNEQYGLRAANALEDKILTLGAENIIGFIAETVVGTTAGVAPPAPSYFKRIREICDQYGILLILDEIMCGMGRCGAWFTFTQENIQADIITIAKGLGAGYQPIGATLLSKQINEAIETGSGYFQHGHTYLAHPSVCAAALAVQHEIDQHNLLDNVQCQGKRLMNALSTSLKDHPYVGDIRGRGLFIGIEFVKDKTTKAPFPSSFPLHTHLKQTAMQQGLMVLPMSGTIDGQHGHHVMIAPPFILENKHIDEIIEKLTQALAIALSHYSD